MLPVRVYSTAPHVTTRTRMEKRKLRSTAAQIRVLVDQMAMKPHLAINDGSNKGPAARTDMEWIKLKHLLREYGPDKSIEQWKTTWRDLRNRAKHEYEAVVAETKDGAELVLSTQTKAVLEAIRFWKPVGGEEATSSTPAKPDPEEENGDQKENGRHDESVDPLDDELCIDEPHENSEEQEASCQSIENTQEQTLLSFTVPITQNPKKRTYRKYSDPAYSRSPSPPRKRRNEQEETLSTLEKFLEYEREKERLAHEREMSRIAQNDKVVKLLGRMVTVLESLAPGVKKYLQENSHDSS